jgi:hypothetical protein
VLVATITFAIFAQAQPAPSNAIVNTSNGGIVSLQLPPGVPSHPVNVMVSVFAIDKTSSSEAANVMEFYIWVPAVNSYLPVAFLSTDTNQTVISTVKTMVNGSPVWTPPTMMNLFNVNASQLQITMNEKMLVANLTTSVNVSLPDSLGGNFTIPPMTLMFIPIADGFAHNQTTVIPSTNWTISMSHTDVPSWVRVTSPMWLGLGQVEVAGTMVVDATTVYTPPK